MAQWVKRLSLLPEYEQAKTGEVTVQQLAKVVSDRIKAIGQYEDESIEDQRLELADNFLDLSEDDKADVEDFDDLMVNLYDWADTKLDNEWNSKKVA
jgi:hypothetical protein